MLDRAIYRFKTMQTFVIALCSIMLSVSAQFLLKRGMSGEVAQQQMMQPLSFRSIILVLTDWFVLGGFVLYGVGAVVWLWVLSKWDVSKAYPLVGIGFLLTLLIGMLQGEQITFLRIAGTVAISLGIWMLSQS